LKDAEAVKRYQMRKLLRLKARFDAEDVDWITTETGSHVPIKDGVAIGGPMKGQKFLRATTEKPDGTNRKTGTRRRRRTTKTTKSRASSTKETTTTAKPKISATHQKFKDRLADYASKIDQAKKDIARYAEEADNMNHYFLIYEFSEDGLYKRGDFFYDKERLQNEIERDKESLKEYQKYLRKMDNPPKRGERGYADYHGAMKLYGIASKNREEQKKALTAMIEGTKNQIKEDLNIIEIVEEYETKGTLEKRDALLKECKEKQEMFLQKSKQAEESVEKYKEARKALVNKTLPTWESCKDGDDIKERVLNCGLFKVTETVKDGWLGAEIPDISSRTNINKMEIGAAKEALKHIQSFFDRYPKLAGMFKPVSCYTPHPETEYQTAEDKAYASTSLGNGKVSLNRAFFEDPKKVEESERKMKAKNHRAVYGGLKSIVFHEYGHAIDGLLTKKLRKDGTIGEDDLFSDRVMKQCLEKFKKNELELHKSLCNYGLGDRSEFLAEAFAEYTCSDKPRELARFVGKLVEDEMKRQGYL